MTELTSQSAPLMDARPKGDSIAESKNVSLLATDQIKIRRMFLLAGKSLAEHKAPGDLVVQCIEGSIEFATEGKTHQMQAGHLIYLTPGQLHSVHATEDSSFLLTIFQQRE